MKADTHTYYPGLDGLRFVCCVMVILGHCFALHPWAPQAGQLAHMGVRIFFALSGFLITLLLCRESSQFGSISIKNFYIKRVLRIFPVYYTALGLALLASWLLGDGFLRPFGCSQASFTPAPVALSYGLFWANWVTLAVPSCLDVLWSVSVEEQFYLLYPQCWRCRPARANLSWLLAACLAAAYVAKGVVAGYWPDQLGRNSLALSDQLFLGCLLASLVDAQGVRRLGQGTATALEVIWLGLLTVQLTSQSNTWSPGWLYADHVVAGWLAVVAVFLVGTQNGFCARVLRWRGIRYLGGLTYAAYVFHMYAVVIAWHVSRNWVHSSSDAAWVRFLLAVPLTFLIAGLVRNSFEGYFLRLKAQLSPRRIR